MSMAHFAIGIFEGNVRTVHINAQCMQREGPKTNNGKITYAKIDI